MRLLINARCILIIWIALVSAGFAGENEAGSSERKTFIAVKVKDVISFPNGSNVVFLHDIKSDLLVPIWIGGHEAYAIDLRLNRQKPARPVTLDILEQILKISNIKVEKLEIDDLKSGIFLGRLYIKKGDKVHIIDTRPSDSIGLCLGMKAPIYVAYSVLKKTGISKEEILEKFQQEKKEDNEKDKEPDDSTPGVGI